MFSIAEAYGTRRFGPPSKRAIPPCSRSIHKQWKSPALHYLLRASPDYVGDFNC